jgi:UDP-2,3-diacylglucosamine hydrolase
MPKTLFISDLHLEVKAPERTDWMLEFLSGPASAAEAVYILGDLFEYWIGDDCVSDAAAQVAEATATLHRQGACCFFIHGNRDFLLGQDYAARAGLELLPETCVIDLYGKPTLLLHGDTLCTDDVKYQAFRQQARNPDWQASVLALPVGERIKLAQEARTASADHTGSTSMEIMDVNPDAVFAAFRSSQVSRMIHGHTHRPAHHFIDLDGVRAERIGLADWYHSGSFLEATPDGLQSKTI